MGSLLGKFHYCGWEASIRREMFIKTPGSPLLADQMSDPGKRELVRFQKMPHWGFVPGEGRRLSGTVLHPGQALPSSEREWRGPCVLGF